MPAMNRTTPRRIFVSLPAINRPERLKLDGILAFAHERHAPAWRVELDFAALQGRPSRLAAADCDGIVAYVESDARRDELLATGVPLVLIEDALRPARFPTARHVVTLLCDHEAEGRAAADYFLARHFRHFAWLGPVRAADWSDARRDGFVARLRERGLACARLGAATPGGLADELRALPRPCALFCVHDFRAREALDAAGVAGLSVPEELAVLGMDDDAAICTTAAPALSSLPTGDFRLGYAAGRVLSELLRHAPGGRVIRFACRHVTSRRSTDADALADPFVAAALRHARNHLDGKLDAATLARRIGYSKRMLQLRAERALGHTLGEEIRRLRIATARDLVAETDRPIAEIADACGYTSVSHLALRFKEAYGTRPLALRKAADPATSEGTGRD